MTADTPSPHLFQIGEGVYLPTRYTASPWDRSAVHGSAAAVLLAREIARAVEDPAFTLGRITFDLFRPVPMRPLRVRAELVRDGRRVKGIDAFLEHEGTVVSRATALAIRQTEAPATPAPDFPRRVLFPDPETLQPAALGDRHREGERFHHFAEVRPFSDAGPEFREGAWVRVPIPFAPGEPLAPLLQLAAIADFTSAFSNGSGIGTVRGPGTVGFINADISLHLHRYPQSEWMAMAIVGRSHTAGISVGHAAFYDQLGPIGRATTVSLAQPSLPSS